MVNTYILTKIYEVVVEMRKSSIIIKKVDRQGRIVLPSSWREEVLGGEGEVFLIREGGILKIIPRRKPDLTKYFDSLDLGVDQIEDWEEFERELNEVS